MSTTHPPPNKARIQIYTIYNSNKREQEVQAQIPMHAKPSIQIMKCKQPIDQIRKLASSLI